MYRDGPKLRVETTLANNAQAVVVFDQATHLAYVLNPNLPATQTAMDPTAPPANAALAAATQPAPEQSQPIEQGFAVQVSDADAPQPLEAQWGALGGSNAESVGDCSVANERGHVWRSRELSEHARRTACITSDGIVLRLNEGERVLFQATSVQRGPQAAALFGIPPGYRIINPAAATASEVSNTMKGLNSTSGQSIAAPPATSAPVRPAG
jgi:hypothetical protein